MAAAKVPAPPTPSVLRPALVQLAAPASLAALARYPAWLRFNLAAVQALLGGAQAVLGEQPERPPT